MLGYLFYAYGIYVIGRIYNLLQLLYINIMGLTFYSIIYAIACIRREIIEKVHVSQWPRFV